MNAASDTLLNNTEEKADTVRQEQKAEEASLVELGRVSDTQGGWIGSKIDTGAGFLTY